MFSRPCYDRGRVQICSTALTRELNTFANVREEICWFWRGRSLLTMKFIWRYYWILKRKVYLAKWIIFPNIMVRGPMQLHRLHWLKAGPDADGHGDWQAVEGVLSKDMSTKSEYLQTWKLKLSTTKTVSAVFYLNKKKLNVSWKSTSTTKHCPFAPSPNTSG